jgi:DNA-binding NarL/FixJ family response regulator
MSEPVNKQKVFLVDDHPLVREWLTSLINQEEDLVVCGEASNAPEALQGIESTQPDAVVVDLALPNTSGLDLIKDLRVCQPSAVALVLSMHDESIYGMRALRAGARGYVTKRETTKKVIAALHDVLAGKLFVSEELAAVLAGFPLDSRPSDSPDKDLSERELQVFELLGEGFETRRIAESLNINVKTVQTYCARIKEKLNVENVNELMREAVRWASSKD